MNTVAYKRYVVTREFPSYSKVDLNSPLRSSTCSKRCVTCSQKFPDHPAFDVSPCCDVTTTVIKEIPDMSWEDAKRFLLKSRFEKYYGRANKGLNEDQLDYVGDPLEIDPKELEQAFREVVEEVDDLTSRDDH